ncbi:GatB/YqeY domain-containing protein [Anaeromyxobacter diazotrophicus]|uniref:Aspartyl-tRNA amidotransferase subunit B n=1 Tax=Anaeromyxobacter diazotrophicus TaxID=2590199 RepID=A0A7I9VGT4_9BACT|nr:GatB/YqeY domain-containing protein [Anaeromyxobacter diazotrophicus]GEJ55555.1 aspartyl-tRNA amidotransferase subunit B [Anaeromyxobacter diazotrophicus]
MALKEQLDADLKSAMREKDQLKLSTVRMLKSAIKYREIELMKPLDDAGVHAVIASEIKRRRDAVEQYRAGGREDLAGKEEAEIAVLQGWMPAQLAPDELAKIVDAVIARVGAQGPKDMGKVMKELLPEVQGKAEGKAVSELVKQRLARP